MGWMVCLLDLVSSRVKNPLNVRKQSYKQLLITRIPRYLWMFQLVLDPPWLVSQTSRAILLTSVIGKVVNSRMLERYHRRRNCMVQQKLKCMDPLGTIRNFPTTTKLKHDENKKTLVMNI